MYRDPTWLEFFFYLVLATVMLVTYVRDRLEPEPNPLEELKSRRARGEIDQQTFEHELEFVLDDRNEQIRAVVEGINGVGDVTSKAIAYEFDSLEALRRADREELEAVHGVGESTAEAVLERVQ